MSPERLATLMQAQRWSRAMAPDERTRLTHETILAYPRGAGQARDHRGEALGLLALQATLLADEPTQAARYRQAALEAVYKDSQPMRVLK
jgi:hypothetical protein